MVQAIRDPVPSCHEGRCFLHPFLDRKYTGLITYLIEQEFDLNFKNKVYFKRSIRPWYHKLNYRSSIEECLWFTKGKGYTFNFGAQKK